MPIIHPNYPPHPMKETLETIGNFAIGIAVMVGIALVTILLIHGGVWLSDKLYPWFIGLSTVAIAVSVFILLPLAAFKRTRGFSGAGLVIASYVFGATLWVWSLLLTYILWGAFALLIGLFIAGVGVLPIAMLATAFNGSWSICGQLILLTAITFATRGFGVYLVSKAEDYECEVALRK